MRDVKKVLELRAQGKSQRFIATALGIFRNRVSSIFKSADEKKIYWNLIYELDDLKIEELLFPRPLLETVYVMPDFEHIHKELLKDGVTLKLLW